MMSVLGCRKRGAPSPRAWQPWRTSTQDRCVGRRSPPKLAISLQFLVIIADLCSAAALGTDAEDGANFVVERPELEPSRQPQAGHLWQRHATRDRGQAQCAMRSVRA